MQYTVYNHVQYYSMIMTSGAVLNTELVADIAENNTGTCMGTETILQKHNKRLLYKTRNSLIGQSCPADVPKLKHYV